MIRKSTTTAVVVSLLAFASVAGLLYLHPQYGLWQWILGVPDFTVANGFDSPTDRYLLPSGENWYRGVPVVISAVGVPMKDANGHFFSSTGSSEIGTFTTDAFGRLGTPPVRIQVTPFCGTPPAGLVNPVYFAVQRARFSKIKSYQSGDKNAWFTGLPCGQ